MRGAFRRQDSACNLSDALMVPGTDQAPLKLSQR